ncbi:MAG: hypothetical protein ABFC24_05865 [Methanoregulaceae archaeon]
MEITDSLKAFMETGEDWERKNTSLKGVSIIRLPKTKTRPASLAIDINPVNERGLPIKKKGMMIMSREELLAFREVFSNEKVDVLLKSIEEVIPGKKAVPTGKEDILQI